MSNEKPNMNMEWDNTLESLEDINKRTAKGRTEQMNTKREKHAGSVMKAKKKRSKNNTAMSTHLVNGQSIDNTDEEDELDNIRNTYLNTTDN